MTFAVVCSGVVSTNTHTFSHCLELFHQIETRDDDSVVENIIQGMLNKEFVRETFKTDLGLDSDEKKKKKDPRVTMDARQRRVWNRPHC